MQRIAICAPATPITPQIAERVRQLAAQAGGCELHFHDQCFASDGHFAGRDEVRLAALLDCANDPLFDAVWFAKGGYGANRIAAQAIARMDRVAGAKVYCGYSDCGYLLAALYRAGIGRPAHAPMPVDARREGGDAAIIRVLEWFAGGNKGLEPSLDGRPAVAFNLMTLAMLVGTRLMPNLAHHVVMVEEVAEHLYAIDRLFFHLAEHLPAVVGLRLGRVSLVPENDRPFGAEAPTSRAIGASGRAFPFLVRPTSDMTWAIVSFPSDLRDRGSAHNPLLEAHWAGE